MLPLSAITLAFAGSSGMFTAESSWIGFVWLITIPRELRDDILAEVLLLELVFCWCSRFKCFFSPRIFLANFEQGCVSTREYLMLRSTADL